MDVIKFSIAVIFTIACLISPVKSKLGYNEDLSVSLIENIDRVRRSLLDEFGDSASDHHGHTGEEDVTEPKQSKFTNEWVVQITGGASGARALAEEMGYDFIGQVPGMADMYRLMKSDHPRRSRDQSHHLSKELREKIEVVWAEQQFHRIRQKRGYLPDYQLDEIRESETEIEDRPLVRIKRNLMRKKRGDLLPPPKESFRFNDKLWDHQWYMHDTRTKANLPRLDLNVLPVYDMNITGRGVTIVVLDDGLETNHTDLRKNYRADVSHDVNDEDADPSPRYGDGLFNSHGTRCAGEIAMEANNGKCGVGVAFNANIGGIRMLDGTVSDRVEATSLVHALDTVDIYSSSWGPSDDGRTVEGPGRLTLQSLQRGVTQGRGGKGAIYIWASGNGGKRQDNCNCDGYVSSPYTLAIGSVSESGEFPWYGEKCAATMAVTYSSGAYTDQKIATTDLGDACTLEHTGTSAAAPLAAGVVALALEANPGLTWRDVQHLVAWTSEYAPLRDNDGWLVNAAGFRVNPRFGFGLMNAASMVRASLNWTSVPDKSICSIQRNGGAVQFTSSQPGSIEFASHSCRGTRSEVNHLEHVEVVLGIEYPIRGNLQIDLTSPSGTQSRLLMTRPQDASPMGFVNWPFTSVHAWGEDPAGTWRLVVTDALDDAASAAAPHVGRIVNATLLLHGTSGRPEYRKNGNRRYDDGEDAFSAFRRPEPMTNRLSDDADAADADAAAEQAPDVGRLRKPDVSWNDLIGLKLARSGATSPAG